MASQLYFVRVDEDWVRSSTLTATSEQTGYEATQAGTDDPSAPWWANSTTATLTVTFGATREVGLIALVMTNAGDGQVITIAGGITGSPTLTGSRDASGYPRDLVYIVDPPQSLTAVTIAVTGNPDKFSIGRVVIGKRRSLGRTFTVGAYSPGRARIQYTDENEFGHDIRYDMGVERASVKGTLSLTTTDRDTLEDAISASLFGFYPTLFVPNVNHISTYPPIFARFPASVDYDYYAPNMCKVDLNLVEVSKGLEVVD